MFLSIVAPCDINGRRESFRREVDDSSGVAVQQVTLICGDTVNPADYFFDLRL